MEISYFENYDLLAAQAFDLILGEIRKKPDALICTATGKSPGGIYRKMVAQGNTEPSLFSRLRIIKLDEWYGITPDSEGSCESYLRAHLLDPLQIGRERYISFLSNVPDPDKECSRISTALQSEGPVDLAILGLGTNGHLGFNEPGMRLEPRCHLARLTTESQQHGMMQHLFPKPEYGMTLGMGDILASGMIVLIVAGEGKKEALTTLLEGKISTGCPASFLWLHDHVFCLVEQ